MFTTPTFPLSRFAAAVALALGAQSAFAAPPTLEEKVEILQTEVDELKALVMRLTAAPSAQTAATASQVPAPSGTYASQMGPVATSTASYSGSVATAATPGSTTIGGYGEFAYNRYRNTDVNNNQADLRRFVLFFGHQFNDRLRFFSEFEIEHAVASSDDRGEAELEQAYLAYHVNDAVNFKGGLFLMPLGIINETHEPPTYYGVERNFVETRIIPSTWREGGIGMFGEIGQGLKYDVGVTTGFDAGKIDDPAVAVRSGHQEMQLANANNLAVYGALNYRGQSGLLVGGGVFTGNTGQNGATLPALKGVAGRLTLWDAHLKYATGRLELQSVYARGTLGNSGTISNALVTASGDPGLIAPKVFSGWYAQAAYHVWKQGDVVLAPFIRFERYDTQAGVAAGYVSDPLNRDRVVTAGLSFKLTPQVVIKADYQKFSVNPNNDRLNLGLGYMF